MCFVLQRLYGVLCVSVLYAVLCVPVGICCVESFSSHIMCCMFQGSYDVFCVSVVICCVVCFSSHIMCCML